MKFQKLKQVISGRLVKNHFTNNFRRSAILEMFRDAAISSDVSAGIAQSLNQVAFQEPEALLTQLNSYPNGLANSKLMRFARIVGFNQVHHEKSPQYWILLWHCYNSNPFSLLLSVLALISCSTDDLNATIVISLMIVLSTLVRFIQKTRSNQAAVLNFNPSHFASLKSHDRQTIKVFPLNIRKLYCCFESIRHRYLSGVALCT